MPYDASLDKELFAETLQLETTRIKVSVHSYNEGPKKLQLSRENINPNNGSWKWSKLGRMTKEEVEGLLPLLQKAVQHL